jgi:hypothetical protein
MTTGIKLHKLAEFNTVWHKDTSLVFESRKELFVIGKLMDNRITPLSEADIKICNKYKFKYKLEHESKELPKALDEETATMTDYEKATVKRNEFFKDIAPGHALSFKDTSKNSMEAYMRITGDSRLFYDGNQSVAFGYRGFIPICEKQSYVFVDVLKDMNFLVASEIEDAIANTWRSILYDGYSKERISEATFLEQNEKLNDPTHRRQMMKDWSDCRFRMFS